MSQMRQVSNSAMKVVSFFAILILVLVLLQLLGPLISSMLPTAGYQAHNVLSALWDAISQMVPQNPPR